MRTRIERARSVQHARYGAPTKTNSDMTVRDLDTIAALSAKAEATLTRAATNLKLSPRSYHRTVKLARTIADLCGSEGVEEPHVLEALTYRPKGLFE